MLTTTPLSSVPLSAGVSPISTGTPEETYVAAAGVSSALSSVVGASNTLTASGAGIAVGSSSGTGVGVAVQYSLTDGRAVGASGATGKTIPPSFGLSHGWAKSVAVLGSRVFGGEARGRSGASGMPGNIFVRGASTGKSRCRASASAFMNGRASGGSCASAIPVLSCIATAEGGSFCVAQSPNTGAYGEADGASFTTGRSWFVIERAPVIVPPSLPVFVPTRRTEVFTHGV